MWWRCFWWYFWIGFDASNAPLGFSKFLITLTTFVLRFAQWSNYLLFILLLVMKTHLASWGLSVSFDICLRRHQHNWLEQLIWESAVGRSAFMLCFANGNNYKQVSLLCSCSRVVVLHIALIVLRMFRHPVQIWCCYSLRWDQRLDGSRNPRSLVRMSHTTGDLPCWYSYLDICRFWLSQDFSVKVQGLLPCNNSYKATHGCEVTV